MKRFFVLLNVTFGLLCNELIAQQVTISNNTPSQDASAIVDIKNTEKGILLPRMTASQRAAINQPAKGLLVFQTDGTNGFYFYDGNAWLNLDGGLVNDNGVSEQYGITTVFAGSTYGTTDGQGTAAKFKGPVGITLDRLGNLFIADSGSYSIRKISPYGAVSFVAGVSRGYVDNIATVASFNLPTGIVADKQDNLYIADLGNNVIRKINPAGNVSTFASGFSGPMGIAIDNNGNLYVADTYNHSIRKISSAGVVTTLAGNGSPGFVNGDGAAASFSRPTGLTLDAVGNIYVADMDNHSIRKVTPSGTVTTIAGSGTPGYNNGPGTTATFHSPKAITIDNEGNLYIADAGNHSIRRISSQGEVSLVAGAGVPGFANGISGDVYFNDPSGVVIDKNGILYVTDTGNYRVRKIVIR